MYGKSIFILLITSCLLFQGWAYSLELSDDKSTPVISENSEACIECHQSYSPGIVSDWKNSRHAIITPEIASRKNILEKRITSKNIPKKLKTVVVGCYECHGLNKSKHADNFEHFDFNINVIVSPNDCKTCHEDEYDQYSKSKKAYALPNLQENKVYHKLVETITGIKEIKNNSLNHLNASDHAKNGSCYACHGTRVEVDGMNQLKTDLGIIETPNLTNWPNQGVGRINPDGSKGACTACHPRHSFSIEIARKPYTCGQCHLEPDVPAYNVYKESKHGNIFDSKSLNWNWNNVPWTVGDDFRAPTCATCHNSLLVNTDGEIIASRSHNFGSRLWIRIFGLIYSHPQPEKGNTYIIENNDGLQLPVTFTGELASKYLLNENKQALRKKEMKKICKACHGPTWVNKYFEHFENTIKETDRMTAAATNLFVMAAEKGLTNQDNPFDEALEHLWIKQWLYYANSVRYASAMSGPDYAAFKNGWFFMTHNLEIMRNIVGINLDISE